MQCFLYIWDLLFGLSPKIKMTEELDKFKELCYYCDSDNEGIRELFCDSNCQNCLDRHFKKEEYE